jgi:thymidine kinase
MFAGKTTELLRRVQEARQEGLRVEVYKPRIDTRYEGSAVVSHDGLEVEAKWVGPSDWAAPFSNGAQVVALDEVQFFPEEVVPIIAQAVRRGLRVIAAGLDLTSGEKPFHPVPALLSLADEVVKLQAECCRCGRPASRSQRLVPVGGTILVGGRGTYEPRCLTCFEPDGGEA